ncbi:hypothetical protein GXN76_07435 [Kroppenstedtia pulmonis]|uniref:Uncharacterized protein n=1 Tax=Kroppenstedtia pulmonis TaxID=1380685 RepID=A0A7D3XQC0_9BACL|nr:hypothetical protein [Kroppenstedtia pulmonis]QKG84322.1 hypothetical protein GXN76_07435 [Kroppenstedtia pulmonis]
MQLARHLFASVFISVMIAALLSLVPSLDQRALPDREIPVFHPFRERVVTESTLVSFLSGHAKVMRIIQADVKEGRLWLSLSVPETVSKNRVYEEMLHVIRNALIYTDNITQVRMDVQLTGDQKLFVEAKKEDLAQDPGMKNSRNLPPKKYLQEQFHFQAVTQ